MLTICLGDLQRRRVSNELSVCVALLALVQWTQVAGAWGLLQWTLGLLLGFSMLAVVYAAGLLGGADVKVFAAYAAFAGVSRLPTLMLSCMLAAGALSLMYLVAWHGASPTAIYIATTGKQDALAQARRTGRTLPLTVALLLGLVVTVAGDAAFGL